MPTAAEIDSKVDDAVTAIEDADWETARTKLMAAKALLAAKPDSRNGRTEMKWDRAAIDSLLRDVRKELNAAKIAANGIQRTNASYVKPTTNPDGT